MKKKLALDLDRLTVDSFETVRPAEGRGTVRGHDSSFITQTTFTDFDTCGEPISGQPCVEVPLTPATLCDENCVVPSNPCE